VETPPSPPPPDVGPDPIWGLAALVVGIVVMAVGGAANWHWVFNAGTGLMLIGVVVLLLTVAITSFKQNPERFLETARNLGRALRKRR
jgi:hypothetical protein